MHIAAIVKTPCIAIFSNTNNPGKFYPQNQNNMIFQAKNNIQEIQVSKVTSGLIKALENDN